MIKVSVIITTFGIPYFLEKAIVSVFNQSFDSIELIIIDDNNPDTKARVLTEKIVSSYNNYIRKIIYIKHKENRNGAAARNTGFAIAKGKYISFLDSDDEYYKDRLEKCYNKLEQSSENIAGVYTGCEFRKNGKRYNTHKKIQSGNFIVTTLACTFMLGTGSNLFIRKSIIDELNGFDEAFLRHQDYEFLVRMFQNYSIKAIPEVLVIKNNENLNLPDVEKQIAIKNQYLFKYKSIIDNLSKADQDYIYHSQAIGIAEAAIRTRNYKIANQYYKLSKQYGVLTVRELFRKLLLPIINLF